MCIFDPKEKVDSLATQSLNYDRYAEHQYFLERVEVNGKYGLACGEQIDEHEKHTKAILPAVYDEIKVSKVSSNKAIYKKYMVYANGIQVALFTLVLNSWVPILGFNSENAASYISPN